MDIPAETLAKATGTTLEVYLDHENGKCDFNFTFLYNCADALGVDIIELLTGEGPKLSGYSIVRKGEGLNINRRIGFTYEHLGYRFKNKMAETFLVTAPYIEDAQDKEIALSTHEGQEFDFIISGSLRVRIDDHYEILNEGDSIYYDSGKGHGMIACGGEDCKFLAVTIHKNSKV